MSLGAMLLGITKELLLTIPPQACVSCVPKPLLFGESNVFVCSVCNLGEEHFALRDLSDRDALHLAVSPPGNSAGGMVYAEECTYPKN